ncbi:N-6 DNA methylase [Kitasatospora sp. RG8]|uniref:N-6 DNA methylase n=1 Tax=Kitasatospora sp. RG8 TaxID=2820815 RepID=UPI001FD83E5C|nr:N-6 DNA methylase [Kitasatospora sp. RG8]
MPQQPAAPPSARVTAAEISRIAGVTRATVSNWRRRHADFPAPGGGTETSPLYDLGAVQQWLRERGRTAAASPQEALRTALRLLGAGADTTRFFPLLAAAARLAEQESDGPLELSGDRLVAAANRAANQAAEQAPNQAADQAMNRAATARGASGPAAGPYGSEDAGVIRALLACVRGAGPRAALDVLAERELDESAAGGTYRTPEGLAELMAALLPGPVLRVLDPACGSGSLLAAARRRGARELYGQDALALQAQRASVALMLDEPGPPAEGGAVISTGDSLRADAFPGLTADAVLCNPPFGDRDWGRDELAYDPRWAYGVPSRFESELAWVQHALAHVEPGGYVVMLLPPALAFRTSARRVRAELVRSGAVRAVVSLPARVAHPLHIALHVWVLQRPEPGAADRASVLFVDGNGEASDGAGSGVPVRGGPRGVDGVDWAGLAERVLAPWTAYRARPEGFADESGSARAVPVVDLLDDVVDLTPGRRVRAAEVDPAALAGRIAALHGQLGEQLGELAALGGAGECEPAGAATREWRTVTVADLARGGALAVVRASPPGGGRDPRGGGSAPAEAGGHRPVLTARDVRDGTAPSGDGGDAHPDTTQAIAAGDVLLRAAAGTGGAGPMTRVADEGDAGALLGSALHLLRPDPARLDPWFLAGFLGAADNISAASTGTTTVQVNPARLRVPLVSLTEQRRYGEAFRHAHRLRVAAHRAAAVAAEAATAVTAGLTAGALLPPVSGGAAAAGRPQPARSSDQTSSVRPGHGRTARQETGETP